MSARNKTLVGIILLNIYLKDNPQIKHIIMMLDNDEVGIKTGMKNLLMRI